MNTNFAKTQKFHFIKIILIIIGEFIALSLWSANQLLADGIDINKQWNVVIGGCLGVLFIDLIWLWIEDRIFFNKTCIMNRINCKESALKKQQATIEKILRKIIDVDGKQIRTNTATKTWQSLRRHSASTFEEVVKMLNDQFEHASTMLPSLEDKRKFFFVLDEENLLQYARKIICH